MPFSSPERIYPESIEPSDTDGWVLTTVGGEAAWAESTGGSGGGGTTTWPLTPSLSGAIFYYLATPTYGEYDGTGIISATGTSWPDYSFSEIPELDPTHTYEITVEFDTGFGGPYAFWAVAQPDGYTDADYNLGDWSNYLYNDTNDLSSGTTTFQIGPGIEGWDTAVVAGDKHFLVFESHRYCRLTGFTINDLDYVPGSSGSLGGVPVFLLDFGQTVADFETLAGYSIPVPAIIIRKDSSGGDVGWVPVYLLDLGQSISDYETLHGVTIPSPAVIARKTT